jgi:hypothetical protein
VTAKEELSSRLSRLAVEPERNPVYFLPENVAMIICSMTL